MNAGATYSKKVVVMDGFDRLIELFMVIRRRSFPFVADGMIEKINKRRLCTIIKEALVKKRKEFIILMYPQFLEVSVYVIPLNCKTYMEATT